ncbi:RxLR-like protein [Plasmopara halstedii]|uniref:RxLR-like protein n=1 Tax=Plasmopara halstedii TaxID=4781 RepID=A0A0P1A5L1_PLAHL|nr:RxLR-like protein [Plasmopara halstedii]CEG35416.1 RxLR-like protein [Plasmopara halstedii]|eukprot:XP_024571785.1 RxLR-like protein [Plasmopara halstedii]
MVLPVKKMLAFTLCVSTFAALDVAQILALQTHSHRTLEGIHHRTQYAPKVVKQPKDTPEQEEESESSDSCDSHDIQESGSLDVNLLVSDELELTSAQDVDLDVDGGAKLDIILTDGEVLDYDGNGEQTIDLSSSCSLDFSADASLDAMHEMNTELDLADGNVDLELNDDEEYTQDLEFNHNEIIDEIIDVPEGAKSIHLRVHNGNVDLDIIKEAVQPTRSEAHPKQKVAGSTEKEPKKKEKKEHKKVGTTTATPTKETSPTEEISVSYAAEAKEWIGKNAVNYAIMGSIIGAAVGIVGIAGIAIVKRRKRSSDSAEDAPADIDAEVELGESDLESDSYSDEDVKASPAALTEESAEEEGAEEKKSSVVEGSV